MPNQLLKKLESNPDIFRVHFDRPIKAHNYRTRVTVGADIVQNYGVTGAGIGIAVIDSGIATWHDDLTNNTSKVYPYGNQRVSKFVDFVNGRALPYDDNGHGTHVAGIIAGNGYDSKGEKAGIAPGASIVALKVLDARGQGTISNIIGALNWVAANYKTYNIRVVNMSVGAGVYESYWTDPLTLAAKNVTDKGITIVAAAGNLGKNASASCSTARSRRRATRRGCSRLAPRARWARSLVRTTRWRPTARRDRPTSITARSRISSRQAPGRCRYRLRVARSIRSTPSSWWAARLASFPSRISA